MRLLVTGGNGFIGSHFVRNYLKKNPTDEIVNLDVLSYAGRKENLLDVEKDPALAPRYHFMHGDIRRRETVEKAMQGCEAVVHFAAESHVDNSLNDASIFIDTNVTGTYRLLEAARKHTIKRFLHVSTDEVYGHILEGSFSEKDLLHPRNPYSASKAGAEMMVQAFHETYGLPAVITRSSNNFGPNQFPEKVIPLFITNLLRGKKVPLYGEGKNIRDWIFVEDNCAGIELVLQKGKVGEVYNIAGEQELTNLELTHAILKEMGHGEEMIQRVEDRKGHDLRYSLDASKAKALGYSPSQSFSARLHQTIAWYRNNEWWWKPLVKN